MVDGLRNALGERLATTASAVATHAVDEGWHEAAPPDAVAYVETTDECAAVVRVCAEHGVPMLPFGAGTSLEGHVLAVQGGVSIDLSRMTRVLEVNVDDLDCRVEAGITRQQLNARLEKDGVFFPIDPGAEATLGGMAGTGASGTTAVRYGTMRENVLGMTVVLPDGCVIETGGRARKSSAGYDLTRLMVGSEGTLGVITELQLRVQPLPEAVASAVCAFEDVAGAVSAVVEVLQAGIPVARSELMDEQAIGAVNRAAGLGLAEKPTIFFEFQGTPKAVEEHAALAGEIAAENGGGAFAWSTEREKRDALWEARHKAYYSIKLLRPGCQGWPTDVAVPVSRLAECIVATREDVEANGLFAPVLGHVGDGNFHAIFVLDREDGDEVRRIKDVQERMIARALEMGGTCTGEHGIGFGKAAALRQEHGEGVEVMRAIKAALDPRGLMNPGKIFG